MVHINFTHTTFRELQTLPSSGDWFSYTDNTLIFYF